MQVETFNKFVTEWQRKERLQCSNCWDSQILIKDLFLGVVSAPVL